MTRVKSEGSISNRALVYKSSQRRALKTSDDSKPLFGRLMNDICRYNNTCRLC